MFVVKVPLVNDFEETRGCARAGNSILSSLKEIYSNEEGEEVHTDSLDIEEIHVDNENIGEANSLIYKNSLEIFQTKDKTIFLGGDHSITYPIGKSFLDYCESNNKKPCLIVFDARPNCAQSANKKIPANEKWLKNLIGYGFPKENIFLVGVRNPDKSEIEFIKKNKIKVMRTNQLLENLEDSCDTLMEFSKNKELYLSMDISTIDPAFAPGTKHKEPGGLSSREFVYLIQRFNKLRNIRAIDLTEVNPTFDKENLTVKLGAKILAELL